MTNKTPKIININPAIQKKQSELDKTLDKTMAVIREASDKLINSSIKKKN